RELRRRSRRSQEKAERERGGGGAIPLTLSQSSSTMSAIQRLQLSLFVIGAAAAAAAASHIPIYDRHLFMRSKTASPDQSPMRTCAEKDKRVEDLARLAAAVCLNCHELNSHRNPNYNYECSANCYQNDTFRNCLKAFVGEGKKRPSKRSRTTTTTTTIRPHHVRLLEMLLVPGYF
ncbi:hypothetical protein PMAYCL1PPCAC_32617, partial [Pristionchus mayeri]